METIQILNLGTPKLKNRRRNRISGFIYNDEDETDLISPNEAKTLYSKIELDRTQEHYSAILKCLEKIM